MNMNRKDVLALSVALVVSLSSAPAMARADDPMVGTWKLNAEKSKNSRYKSGTVTVEPAGNGLKVNVDLVATDGSPSKWSFTASDDGKDHPITGTTPLGDSLSVTRVDTRTLRATYKQGGKETVTQTTVVAEDGKTRTVTTKGTTATGQAVDSMTFYDKQ